jgi:hypothetical protein
MFPQQIAISLLPLFLAAGTTSAHAATRIWTGAQNGLWSNPANWTNNLVPTHLDSVEFPAEANVREMTNDLSGLEFGGLIFKGGRYTLKGNKLFLLGGITSIPGNTTNRVACEIFVGAPMTFSCHGYFNLLELGAVEVAYPLRLETGSWIQLSGDMKIHDDIAATVAAPGRVTFNTLGRAIGTLILESGTIELTSTANRAHIEGLLIVGADSAVTPARVFWGAPNKLGNNSVVVLNRSGLLDMNKHSDTIRMLSGAGTVELNGGQLTVSSPGGQTDFAGKLQGTGIFRAVGFDGGFALSGQHSFTGAIEVAAAHLRLAGSASNAVVTMTDLATLSGHGVARSLTATKAVVRPGPGTLRFLEGFTLDAGTLLDTVLDGPDAGSVQAATVNLNQAALRVTYHGTSAANQFALVTANATTTGSTFQNYAEGAWLLAGDPLAPHEFQLTYAGGGGHDVVLHRAGRFVPPVLRIESLPGGPRRLAWPRTAQGFTLQRTPTLSPPLWTAADLPAPAISEEEFQVLDASSNGNFFRLAR